MSGTAGAAPPPAVLGFGLDVGGGGGSWQQRSARGSAAPPHVFPLGGAGLPAAPAAGNRAARAPLRLPSLVAGPRRRSSMARLSLSEPSLFTTNDNVPLEGLSRSRRPGASHQRQTPPLTLVRSSALLPGRTSPRPMTGSPLLHKQGGGGGGGPTYIHFSRAVQPCSRPRPARRHSHNPALTSGTARCGRRPSAAQHRNSSPDGEPLSVVGRPCLPSGGQRCAAAGAAAGAAGGPARTQLHVFLPSEADGEEADSESVDEGFMDELDSKIGTLKIQRGAAKAAAHRS